MANGKASGAFYRDHANQLDGAQLVGDDFAEAAILEILDAHNPACRMCGERMAEGAAYCSDVCEAEDVPARVAS